MNLKGYPEGKLTVLRAGVVCESSLAKMAEEIELGSYLMLGRGERMSGGDKRPSILSDAMEAVIGAIYLDGGFELIEKDTKEKSKVLNNLGLNVNLAPVVDVSVNSSDYIYNRTLGENTTLTSTYAKTVISASKNSGVSYVMKHFPGYGNNVDTHDGIAIDNRSYDTFVNSDYLPFKSGIEAGVPTILVSHNVVNAIDSELPASLSKKVNDELRNTLGFTGIIMTDDLDMGAVSKYVEDNVSATLAINAGNDMIITTDYESMFNEVLNNVKNGTIKEETINKAVMRIIAWKYAYQLF